MSDMVLKTLMDTPIRYELIISALGLLLLSSLEQALTELELSNVLALKATRTGGL